MAIFVDSQHRHYIGVFYQRDDDRYSGKFLLPSSRAVRWLARFVAVASRLLAVVAVACVLAFVVELMVGPLEFFNYFFAATAWLDVLVLVPYLAIGPLALSRTRRQFHEVTLHCLNDLSKKMYALPLVGLLLLASSLVFMPAFSFAQDGLLYLLVLGPIFIGLTFAVVHYSKPIE